MSDGPYSVHPCRESTGTETGYENCNEGQATSWMVEDRFGGLEPFDNKTTAENWAEHLQYEDNTRVDVV